MRMNKNTGAKMNSLPPTSKSVIHQRHIQTVVWFCAALLPLGKTPCLSE